MAEAWIGLRAAGKLHAELDPQRMVLRIVQRDRVFLYNLVATAEAGRSVVEWSLVPRAAPVGLEKEKQMCYD